MTHFLNFSHLLSQPPLLLSSGFMSKVIVTAETAVNPQNDTRLDYIGPLCHERFQILFSLE